VYISHGNQPTRTVFTWLELLLPWSQKISAATIHHKTIFKPLFSQSMWAPLRVATIRGVAFNQANAVVVHARTHSIHVSLLQKSTK